MDNVMLDNAATDLETQIARYQELSTQKNAIEGRISRAEAERPSVKDKIFQRVLKEYEKELEILNRDLTPLEKEIDTARSSLENKLKDIDIETADLQDKLDEIAFRHRVGEFSDSQKADKQDPIEIEYEELTQRGIEYVQALEKLETIQIDGAATTDDSAPQDEIEIAAEDDLALSDEDPIDDSGTSEFVVIEPTPENEVAPALLDENSDTSSQTEEKLELTPADQEQGFVDPKDWVGEFADGEFLSDPATASDTAAPDKETNSEDKTEKNGPGEVLGFSELDMNDPDAKPDPLSELADPSDDTGQAQDATDDLADENLEEQESAEPADTTQDSSLGFPVLSITKGTGSGKKLPLLPMTMTIGRELDNNIELKDQDVARYHARITYHAGEYVIHDLEGSSGTFVNEEKISKHTLSAGDIIRTGETELKFDME